MTYRTPVVIKWPDEDPKVRLLKKRTTCVHCPKPLKASKGRFCQQHWLEDKKRRGICSSCTKPICPESTNMCVFHVLRQRIKQRKAKGGSVHKKGGRGTAGIVVPEY